MNRPHRLHRGLKIAAAFAVLGLSACADLSGVPPWGPELVAVTQSNRLVTFSHQAPGTLESARPIGGVGGEAIVAIDYRPADGRLYGLGLKGNLYLLDVATGAATLKASLHPAPGDAYAGLSGRVFDIDFNPVDGQLAVVSNDGQNLRVDADSGAVTSKPAFDPKAAGLVGIAYTTTPNGAFATTLYAINGSTREIDSLAPAGGAGVVSVGAIGAAFGSYAGFDIKGNGAAGTAYAALSVPDSTASKLYLVALGSGTAKPIGTIGDGGEKIRSLAIRGSLGS
ncbi:MAG: DUF4394 domain-containing protein [Nevskia sp.]|nr:DUF4394 domain-containing protein [Nevskia sp.]